MANDLFVSGEGTRNFRYEGSGLVVVALGKRVQLSSSCEHSWGQSGQHSMQYAVVSSVWAPCKAPTSDKFWPHSPHTCLWPHSLHSYHWPHCLHSCFFGHTVFTDDFGHSLHSCYWPQLVEKYFYKMLQYLYM